MDFNSPIFLFLFLPVFMIIYFLAPYRGKLVVGILGSLLFYAWGNLNYVLLMLGLTCLAYFFGQGLNHWRGRKLSSVLLWTGIAINVAILVVFKLWTGVKYPLGLSYVTFQAVAYLLEVQKEIVAAEKDSLKFSFYLLLFPKIPVGPIVRYSSVKKQIDELHVDFTETANGARRFIVGFAKKALIADMLGKVVGPVFSLATPEIQPALAWLVMVSYALQLYFDFSGYTDMAIGLGNMMGLRFMENFNFPYISKSIADFWRRWHISLASWFRDFVFYPLERHRLKWIGQPLNILLVFLLVGLWHGFSLPFALWGLIHGCALVFESTSIGRKMRGLWVPLQHLYALSIILVGWVFFRSPSVLFALKFLRRLLGYTAGLQVLPFDLTNPLPMIEPTFLLALSAGILLSLPRKGWIDHLRASWLTRFRAMKYLLPVISDVCLFLLFVASVAATSSTQFVPGIYGAF